MLIKIAKILTTLLLFLLFVVSSFMTVFYIITCADITQPTKKEIMMIGITAMPVLISILCTIILWIKPRKKKKKHSVL